MGPVDVIILLVVLVLVVVAAVRFAGTASGKRDCCSGKAKDPGAAHGKKFAAREVEDKDESHYPYAADLTVGGMTCEKCVEHVTAALDSLDGTWAQVTLAGGRAHVLAKAPVDEAACRSIIEEAGYRLVSFKAQ